MSKKFPAPDRKGCLNDTKLAYETVVSKHEPPEELKKLIANAKPGDVIWVHESGHKEFKPMTKSETRQAALEKHYAVCEALGRHLGMEKPNGKKIGVQLFMIERDASRCAVAYCNGDVVRIFKGDGTCALLNFGSDPKAWDMAVEILTAKVEAVFGGVLPPNFFVNGDPRGHSLKLEPNSVTGIGLHQDWGGFQILSPNLE